MKFSIKFGPIQDPKYASLTVTRNDVDTGIEVLEGDHLETLNGTLYKVDYVKGEVLLVSKVGL